MVLNKDSLQTNFRTPVLVTLKYLMRPNKDSLQNQLQNPRASDPEESNEAFDRAIGGWLL